MGAVGEGGGDEEETSVVVAFGKVEECSVETGAFGKGWPF